MKQLSQTVEFDAALLNKYNQPLPRYTSYPPATELSTDFDRNAFKTAMPSAITNKPPYRFTAISRFVKRPVISAAAIPSLPSARRW